MKLSSHERVVREGTFLYGDAIVCDVCIVLNPVRFGTGDHEDPPEIRDDFVQDTFYVQYGSTTARGVFNAGGGGFASLAAAVEHVESLAGVGKAIRWN